MAAPSPSPIADSLDTLAVWRTQLESRLAELSGLLVDQDLLEDSDAATLQGLRERLAADKLVLAFVAEFSRGKSELINAIFFADAGRRVLPATPGRTTMCPVELRHEADVSPRLSLLPLETRLQGLSLAELRPLHAQWRVVPLDPNEPESLVSALSAVTSTQRVSVELARALGFWGDDQPDGNPPLESDGSVEVPTWRHAVIHYPHPLLQRGLVVIDTPGLNAIGAEPELTLGLLPSAHAVVFVLAADTGVTRSDLAVWQQTLGQTRVERFVVLNKIDTLTDELLGQADVQAQIARQCASTARTLEVPPARVFPLSARQALTGRIRRDDAGVQHSGVPLLEKALAEELMPRRQQLLVDTAVGAIRQLRQVAARRLGDRRRHLSEQLLELRGLRGKGSTKLRLMVQRIDLELADFERSSTRLSALRAVHLRMLRAVMDALSSDALRAEIAAMQSAMSSRPFHLGGRGAFELSMRRLRQSLAGAQAQADEMAQMLDASFRDLNTEFGFAFALSPTPDLKPFLADIDMIEQNYGRYLGITRVWRMAAPGFAEQFRRMLVAQLRVVYENAAAAVDLWNRGAAGQVDVQLRERRVVYGRRREALQRVQAASGELEDRIRDVQRQDDCQASILARLEGVVEAAIDSALDVTTGTRPVARPSTAGRAGPPSVPRALPLVSAEPATLHRNAA